jgi:predicted nucleic acid-binding protein
VPDAHLAAVLRQHGVKVLYTNDVDFKRFSFLTVINPFDDRP